MGRTERQGYSSSPGAVGVLSTEPKPIASSGTGSSPKNRDISSGILNW